MPQFVKMGLNGTGYMGKKESSSRSARKRAERRKVLPGFPITTPFQSIEEVRVYLSGDKVVCLLCGKSYKDVSKHIRQIHGITPDQYREQYNIPWTFGIVCNATSQAYSAVVKKRIDDGWTPPMKIGQDHARMISVKKRKEVFKHEIAIANLKPAPLYPLTVAPDGTMETFSQKKKRLRCKFGSPEHHAKLSEKAKLNASATGERFGKYWLGRKQSEEHKAKRLRRNLIS